MVAAVVVVVWWWRDAKERALVVGVGDGRKLDVYHRGEPLVAWKLVGNICIYCILDHSSLYVNGA